MKAALFLDGICILVEGCENTKGNRFCMLQFIESIVCSEPIGSCSRIGGTGKRLKLALLFSLCLTNISKDFRDSFSVPKAFSTLKLRMLFRVLCLVFLMQLCFLLR